MVTREFARIISPIVNWIGRIHWSPSRRSLSGEKFDKIRREAAGGDLLFSFQKGLLSNDFIPGKSKHVGFVARDGYVIEATSSGVVKTHIYEFCATKDRVLHLRPQYINETLKDDALIFADMQIGKKYDTIFDDADDAFYCSELVRDSMHERVKNFAPIRRKVWGRWVYTPDSISEALMQSMV